MTDTMTDAMTDTMTDNFSLNNFDFIEKFAKFAIAYSP
jgi:hypothetical protein